MRGGGCNTCGRAWGVGCTACGYATTGGVRVHCMKLCRGRGGGAGALQAAVQGGRVHRVCAAVKGGAVHRVCAAVKGGADATNVCSCACSYRGGRVHCRWLCMWGQVNFRWVMCPPGHLADPITTFGGRGGGGGSRGGGRGGLSCSCRPSARYPCRHPKVMPVRDHTMILPLN